jgi:hypothetical protein
MNPKFKTLNVSIPLDIFEEIHTAYDQYIIDSENEGVETKPLSFSKFCVLMMLKSIR